MTFFAQHELNEELEKYAEEMTRRDTLLSAFRSLLCFPAHHLHGNFPAKVRRFVVADLFSLNKNTCDRLRQADRRRDRSLQAVQFSSSGPSRDKYKCLSRRYREIMKYLQSLPDLMENSLCRFV